MTPKTNTPAWSDLKARLADFDRAGLLALVQDLYAASKDNQVFLHSRFALGDNVLEPYKTAINRWLYPDFSRKQDVSLAKARKAVADYKKAVGNPEELAELMVFYCERAARFSKDVGMEDERYFDSLLRMFGQALKTIAALPETLHPGFLSRLDEVRRICDDFGYGVGSEMDDLFAEYGFDDEPDVAS